MVLLLCVGIAALLVSGCASYGVVENAPGPGFVGEQSYSVKTFMEGWRTSENALMLAFSGGGTRAAALSYGVLQELRDTPVFTEEGTIRLLDEVHTISSVSGGSFTSAYYGLHGDGIFDDPLNGFAWPSGCPCAFISKRFRTTSSCVSARPARYWYALARPMTRRLHRPRVRRVRCSETVV